MGSSKDDVTTELTTGDSTTPLGLVIEGEPRQTYALEEGSKMTIGRGADVDIRLDHSSVSRRHASIQLLGGKVHIRDEQSVNGTFVRGEAMDTAWRAIEIGAVIELGQVIAVARRLTPAAPRRLWPHGYFEGRVEEEVARCTRSGGRFAVLRLSAQAPSGTLSVEEVLSSTLRLEDVLASYAPEELEVLLADLGPDEADAIAARLDKHFTHHRLRVRIGIACFPRDASSAAQLLARANAEVRGVRDESPPHGTPTMSSVEALIDHVAPSTISVLVLGETGAGKEVCAEKIHHRSPRASKTLLKLHCAALSETLLESELFGHERGSFTGAIATKQGLIESADGGTVFLDEIGELPMSIQVKLLRVLDDKQTMRVGGLRPRPVDVRFIAATNRDLEAEVAAGRFRKDLYFRLAGMTIEIPPLRERVSEILPLARKLAARAAEANGHAAPPTISQAAASALEAYPWPGNVRELRNVIERGVVLSRGDVILPKHLPLDKMEATLRPSPRATTPAPSHPADRPSRNTIPIDRALVDDMPQTMRVPKLGDDELAGTGALRDQMSDLERERILDAMARCGGNQSAAARMLGISRGTLVSRLDQYGVPRPRKPG